MTGPVILDLDYGNTLSVALAFERIGATPLLSADPDTAARADRLVVPGVGAAAQAMRRLDETGLGDVLRERNAPTLGICLGMQLLFDRSEEDGGTKLLGILPGTVTALRPAPGAPVPHMGWSALAHVEAGIGLSDGDYCYFAHGFACPDGPATAACASHGDRRYPAVVRSGVFWGAQFHPERSSAAGAAFLKAFLSA